MTHYSQNKSHAAGRDRPLTWRLLKPLPWSTLSSLLPALCPVRFTLPFLKQAVFTLSGAGQGGAGKGLHTRSCHGLASYSGSLNSFLTLSPRPLFKCHHLKETLPGYSFSSNFSLSSTHIHTCMHMHTCEHTHAYKCTSR